MEFLLGLACGLVGGPILWELGKKGYVKFKEWVNKL